MNKNSSRTDEKIMFTEERRLNHGLNLKEINIISDMEELKELYAKLEDPSIPRSAPIPSFDEKTEFILVLKPKLKSLPYGDIEIEGIEQSGAVFKVNYKEIENWEFTENKWKNPVVILKVSAKPSEIQLNKIN